MSCRGRADRAIRPLVTVGLVLAMFSAGQAQSEARSVVSASPRYLQRGTVATVLLRCAWVPSAEDILFYSPGLVCQGLTLLEQSKGLPPDGREYLATIRVSADCRIGQHRFRIRDRGGLSTLHTLYVGPLPRLAERSRATTFEDPQDVALNTTVSGYISDVGQLDWYRVMLKKGQRLNVDVQAVRMAQGLFDAHVTVFDARARVLAESDDTGLGLHDPITGLVAGTSGPYMIAIRESGYGNEGSYKGPRGRYLLHVGTFPRPLAVIAAGRISDKTVRMTFLGDPRGPFTQLLAVAADRNRAGFGTTTVTPRLGGQSAPTPHPIRINDLPASTGYGDPVQGIFKFRDGERAIGAMSLDSRFLTDVGSAEDTSGKPPLKVFLDDQLAISAKSRALNEKSREYAGQQDERSITVGHFFLRRVAAAGAHSEGGRGRNETSVMDLREKKREPASSSPGEEESRFPPTDR